MSSKNDPVVIVSAMRTPTGSFGGHFKDTAAPILGSIAIKAAIEKAKISPADIDEVIMGCVLPAGLGQAPARQAAIHAGIPKSTGATTINKMCGSGMKAVMQAHDSILAGSSKIVIAGGMENMSRAPYLLEKARFGYRIGHSKVIDHMMLDGLEDAYSKNAMGYFAEQCAVRYKTSREALDAFAVESLNRAKKANEDGTFSDEIAPVLVRSRKQDIQVSQDEGPLNAKPEKIPTLRPAFISDGVITAANSSSISDGAAALALMKSSQAQEKGLNPLATIIAHHTHAQAPEWFTTAPIGAIQGVLEKAGWTILDVDLFEINEAFAVVTLAAMQELYIPHDKVNVLGGACAIGHPIGASGARIMVTLINALRKKGLKRGVASLCIGGGEATAIAIEINDT